MNSALEGFRIVDFTRAQAGPVCTALLANMGMEVIKVESARQHDFMREMPPHPEGDEGLDSTYYGAFNQNKKSITLDLSRPEGTELARKLISVSDLLVDNFAPGVMDRLGLSYPEVKSVRPDIVVVSLSGYGATGPNKGYVAFAKTIHAYAGLTGITGYADGHPADPMCPLADNITGTYAAFAIVSALYHRARTGEGQFINVSMAESLACNLAEPIIQYTMNGTLPRRRGNRDDVMVPHNTYRCQGIDEWVAVAVASDEEWGALCKVIGKPYLDRFRNEDELDKLIEEWTVARTKQEVMKVLQKAGIAAFPVMKGSDLVSDPHLVERGFFKEADHPKIGKSPCGGPSWKMSDTLGDVWRHAPSEGEHNDYVFSELLGLSRDEIARLVADKVIY